MTEKENCAKQCEKVLASIIGLGMHLLETMKFNRRNAQQLYCTCLYLRLLELAVSCKALMEKNALIGIPVLLRSMFEADIDLTNLLNSADYIHRMNASFLDQKLRAMKEAASSSANPFLGDIRSRRNTIQDLKNAQQELDRAKAKKHGPMNIRDRADLAGRLNEYNTIYALLCLETHNNLKSLESWHIEKRRPGDYHAVAFKIPKADLLHYLSAIPGILYNQTRALALFLNVTEISFDKYSVQMQKLHDSIITTKTGKWRTRRCSRRSGLSRSVQSTARAIPSRG